MDIINARAIISDKEAAALIHEHKIAISFEDDRHPTVFVAEAITFALELHKQVQEDRTARYLGTLSCQSSNPYFA